VPPGDRSRADFVPTDLAGSRENSKATHRERFLSYARGVSFYTFQNRPQLLELGLRQTLTFAFNTG
jgi:hypothetical protein